jgi:hypothetical protein
MKKTEDYRNNWQEHLDRMEEDCIKKKRPLILSKRQYKGRKTQNVMETPMTIPMEMEQASGLLP